MTFSENMTFVEDDITRLVNTFYKRVRHDPILSPIFIDKIGETDEAWAVHTQHIANFWSSIFLKSKRFTGNPMLKHAALKNINPDHFNHWLNLFEWAANETLTEAQVSEIMVMARRVAQSLQMGLAFHHDSKGQSPNPFSEYSPIKHAIPPNVTSNDDGDGNDKDAD